MSSDFARVFRALAGPDATLTFARFMELALYHPEVGYYCAPRTRIGRAAGTDFYTGSTSAPVFGQLVAAACARLLRAAHLDPSAHAFVEIGAEAGAGILDQVEHEFASAATIALGHPIVLTGKCIVFSNELFDAQPCHRYVYRQGRWRELGVHLAESRLTEVELPCDADWPGSEGYHLDRPVAATRLAESIVRQQWTGLFVAVDYGKTESELTHDTPQGTVRAYFRHTQSNALLDRPGQQDLTCHVCWTWLDRALREGGFATPTLESQEGFFIRHAGDWIAQATAAEAGKFSPRKQALMQLLHPAHLGHKFQVLHALR